MPDRTPPKSTLKLIPKSVWALGFVSLLMDISSEMIHGLLPVFLVTVLGASMTSVGLIEGLAEATASITKLFSGGLSDWLGKRKPLAVFGYGLAALSKPLFPLAPGLSWIVTARTLDRIGKGIRGAPRDALIADLTAPPIRGAAYGLRQSLDTVGAFAGPLLAIGFMWWLADDIRTVFWIAVFPAVAAVTLLILFVREPETKTAQENGKATLKLADIRKLGRKFIALLALVILLTLARYSEAFLLLRASDLGLALALVPFGLVVMNVVYALTAYPAGAWSDSNGRYAMLITGICVLVIADIVLAWASDLTIVWVGIALWGLHMGLTQGLLSAIVADAAPDRLRGTAFGLYNFATGVALLAASVIAGLLWDTIGPEGTFAAGAILASVAALGFLAFSAAVRHEH